MARCVLRGGGPRRPSRISPFPLRSKSRPNFRATGECGSWLGRELIHLRQLRGTSALAWVMIAGVLIAVGALYIRLRWRRSPQAYRAMIANRRLLPCGGGGPGWMDCPSRGAPTERSSGIASLPRRRWWGSATARERLPRSALSLYRSRVLAQSKR
jgi:hypothetical protein